MPTDITASHGSYVRTRLGSGWRRGTQRKLETDITAFFSTLATYAKGAIPIGTVGCTDSPLGNFSVVLPNARLPLSLEYVQ